MTTIALNRRPAEPKSRMFRIGLKTPAMAESDNPMIDAARGRDPVAPEPETVFCISCSGVFVRSEDGSIPCEH